MTLGSYKYPVKTDKFYILSYTDGNKDVFKSLRIARIHANVARVAGEFDRLENNNNIPLTL